MVNRTALKADIKGGMIPDMTQNPKISQPFPASENESQIAHGFQPTAR
jgi:hypothetical protein